MFLKLLLISAVIYLCSSDENRPLEAKTVTEARARIFRAVSRGKPHPRLGLVRFRQRGNRVKIIGIVFGLKTGSHGFHIHVNGSLGNGCKDAGAHYNPLNQDHGAPNDTARHVGDLGNIHTTEHGITWIKMDDSKISLNGAHSIVGRTVVIHANPDDLGRGDSPESRKTGNAGTRVACGIIEPIYR
ncbi:copper/zinc superoxide dismutase [Ancylostoma caninum]|uniref:Superoxide dismutase [Cu-Zn] n=1 Tax=Ancylostoma caninum TaxID=29170 RepID=A0A368FUK8_ANCCA|nr:copper/zinc superoxide dismutase [Ancylostoma caninum]